MEKICKLLQKKLYALWLLYLLAVSVISFLTVQQKVPIIITPVGQTATKYQYLFKDVKNEVSHSAIGIFVTNVYIIAPDYPKNVILTIQDRKYDINNNVVFDSGMTQYFTDSSMIPHEWKAFRVINLPQKKLFKLIKKAPFIKEYKIVNYSYNVIWLTLFSPLMVISILAFLFRNKLTDFYKRYQTILVVHLPSVKRKNFIYESLGIILLVLLVFFFIEYNMPYYFLQDDNYTQFYPYLIRGMHSIYVDHALPLYNFHQLNGTPDLGYTTYSYFNPILHIAYWLCLLAKNQFLLLEIFACLNLALSAVIANAALRLLNIRFSIRMVAIFNILFSGYALVAISSWYYVGPYVLFTGLLFYFIVKINKGLIPINIKSSIWIGLICGVFVYGGNIQYWTYSLLFFTLLFIGGAYIYNQASIKRILLFLAGLLTTAVIIGLPNILLGMIETKGLVRQWDFGLSEFADLWNYIVTIPIHISTLGPTIGGLYQWDNHNHFYNIGIIGAIGLVLSIIMLSIGLICIGKNRLNLKQSNNDNLFIIYLCLVNILFLLLSIGRPGVIYEIQRFIPFVNKFRHPFKYALFVVFISNIIGALFINTLFSLLKDKRILDLAMCFLLLILIGIHVRKTNFHFYTISIDKNSVYNDDWIKADTGNIYLNKYLSLAPNRSRAFFYSNSLQLNFATEFDLFSVNGYEPLHSGQDTISDFTDRLKDLKKEGINRLIVWKEKPYLLEMGANFNSIKDYFRLIDSLTFNNIILKQNLVFENDIMAIYKIEGVDPLFFYYKNDTVFKDTKFERTVSGSSLSFQLLTPVNADSLVVNFSYNPRFKVYLNNQPIDKKLVGKDIYDRIVVNSEGIKDINSIKVKYSYFSK